MFRVILIKFTPPQYSRGVIYPIKIAVAIKDDAASKARKQLLQDNLTGLKLLYDGEMAVDCANLFHYKHTDGSFRATKPPEIKVIEAPDFFGHYYE